MTAYVIDASVALKWYLPDEEGGDQAMALLRDHAEARVELVAPALIDYEVVNAVALAVRRKRISDQDASEIVETFLRIGIRRESIYVARPGLWAFIKEYDLTAYDASYLALAESLRCPLLTADKRLLVKVKGKIKWVSLIADYPLRASNV